MAPFRTAILGCGPRGAGHAQAYRHVASGQLTACCDLDERRLDAFAERFGIPRRYRDLAELLTEVQPALLHVVTLPTVRWSVIERILSHPQRPPALLVEKPLANRPGDGYRILQACREAGVALFVNHQLRFHEPFQRLREAVQSGRLGRIEFARGSCRGNLLEQGTHLFDIISFVFGDRPAEWILAQAEGPEGYDNTHSAPAYMAGVICLEGVHVAFECGSPAGTWRQEPSYWLNKGLEVVGTEGRAGSSTNHGWWVHTTAGLEGRSIPYGPEDELAQARLTESILQALADPTRLAEHPTNAERTQLTFDWLMAAQRSALRRARVAPHVEPGARVRDEEIEALRAALVGASREKATPQAG